MEISRQLDDLSTALESNKITTRRHACDDLSELLGRKSTVDFLNENDPDCWPRILSSIQSCIAKDHDKKLEEFRKKGASVLNTAPPSADLFVVFVRVAAKENAATLSFRKLLDFILESLNNEKKKYLELTFLKILSHNFLVHSHIRRLLLSRDWEGLYLSLKSLCEKKNSNTEQIKCLALVIKWGPLYTFPVDTFRGEFAFVARLSQTVTRSSPKQQQEAILELVYEFSVHAAKDNRLACCKLGEEIINNLIEIYQANANEDKMKARLVEFFLLQVAIHNPKGVKENHPAAYAVSWNTWKRCLNNLHNILIDEIEINMQLTVKNQSFFIVKDDIKQLFDGFVCLFVKVCRQLFDGDVSFADTSERPSKRARVEMGIDNLIDKLKTSKSWTWINLLYPLIEAFPDMINSDGYVALLTILTSLQVECKDVSLLHHVYKALSVLKKIENVTNVASHKPQIDQLWKSVADSSLRLMGNQRDHQIQTLLQQLILDRYIDTHDSLLQHYRTGGALNVTNHNLKTLDVAFKTFTYLQFDNGLKTEIVRWILDNNSKCFCHSNVAKILVCLILKQWPKNAFNTETALSGRPFEDIEDVYFTVCFENLIVSCQNNENHDTSDIFCVDQNLFTVLIDMLTNLTKNLVVEKNVGYLLNVTILFFNIISYLIKFDTIDIGSLCDFNLYELFEICAKNLFTQLQVRMQISEDKNLESTTEYVEKLNILFGTNISVLMSKQLRKIVPQNLIKEMFKGLGTELEEGTQENSFMTFKKSVMETLVNFSCQPDAGDLLDIQQRALECLIETDYDYTIGSDYELALTLLQTLISCKPESLSENFHLSIFNVFQKICEVRYHCYSSAVTVLHLFSDIYPFVNTCKSIFVEILTTFYGLNYGPGVSVALLNCMGLVFQLEPTACPKLSNEEIVLKIPEFLTSDYQDVRFAAIRNLAKFFEISSKTRLLEQYHLQEIMFSRISEMSLQVFEIEGNASDERIIDETATRSASILHTFAAIMVASYVWTEESLFTLLRIVCDKNLGFSQVKTVIDMVGQKLGFETRLQFLEKYVVALVNRWKIYGVDSFPFQIFNCATKIEFYTKYWTLLAPVIIENDASSLNEVAVGLGAPLHEIVEETGPKLLSYCIAQEICGLKSMAFNEIYKFLNNTLGENKSEELFKKNIHESVLCLSDFICDERDYENSFGEKMIFPKGEQLRLSVEQFHACVRYVETMMYDSKTLMAYLLSNNPDKLHHILLALNLRVDAAKALEEKLRYFHLYSVISLLCIESATCEASMQPYLVRVLTHTFLHHIKNHKNQPELSRIACKLFKEVLQKFLSKLANVVVEFFSIVVSRLKNVALEECEISDSCVDMLEYLIVNHRDQFRGEIEKLDSIPKTPKFAKIYKVHYSIKYSEKKVTLEDEIEQFLDFGRNIESFDECEHSLIHLRTLLTERKNELKNLYLELRKTRGFSEDCENSTVHQLICMLITLSCSSNRNVSTEAVRCLGEIGPADLTTLILQPEKPIPDPKWTPWELVLGYSLSLLSKYIVDSDVKVVEAATTALFKILSTKDGRKVAESETDFGFGAINPNYFTPFCALPVRKTNISTNVNGDNFKNVMENDNLWIPTHCCHKTWITDLVSAFLETFQEVDFFASFVAVCRLKTEFCEQILPLVLYTVLYSNVFAQTCLISGQIKIFFDHHWEVTVNNRQTVSITTNKSSVQCMLNVVHFIRLQQSVRKKHLHDMKLDYLKVAKAAHFCTAHFTALLYAEFWCQEQINQEPSDDSVSTSSYTKLDSVYERVDEVTGNALQNILRQAYKAVGEVDALLGCGTFHLLNPTARIDHYKELGRWDVVTHSYEMQVSLGNQSSLGPLVQSLKNANLYQLSLFCSNALDEPNYESLWRLGQWEYTKSSGRNSGQDYHKSKFYAFKALHDNDEFSFKNSMAAGRACVVEDFRGANMESIKNFYSSLARLQCLKEIEDFAEAIRAKEIEELLGQWKVQDEMIQNDYQYVEPVQAQRIVLLTELLKEQRGNPKEAIIDTILECAQCARIENNPHVAFRTLESLRMLPSLSNDVLAKIQLEEAQLCWSIQDVVTAKRILRQLSANENVNPRLHAMALKMSGKWMVESSSENRQTIIENYFRKSLTLLDSSNKTSEDQKSILDTFDQLAKFADREYQEVMTHIKSDIFQKKKENIVKATQNVSNINLKRATRDLQKAVSIKVKQSKIDETEIMNIEVEKNNLLQSALKYYLLNLIGSDDHNITIFRLISLLLENRNNDLIRPVLTSDLSKIPSYKFIAVLPQLIPHISTGTNDPFSQTVDDVIERCARDHPHHALPLILSLALSNKDRDYAESKAVANEARMRSARSLLDRLENDETLAGLVEKMEYVSEALIELAYYKPRGESDGDVKVPKNCKIRAVQNYDEVLLPTHTLPVEPSRGYNRIVGIRTFGEVYSNVGGINAPKRITCKATDGTSRTQLVKGQDDLRQDAVMQQVFTMMNSLLTINKQTKNLRIRTYKIVPLSMRSGVLEWVENTMPIGEYLAGRSGDGGAHTKYRPKDKNPHRCRVDFKNASHKTNEEKLRNFNAICAKIKPVFHKFFEVNFPQPTVWYERRRAYIHSVATSSMCGYILGIGDRHLNNVLIDKSTAEVVHIDFGIAFEQGRVLPTPETVPFRLTRDIVDGMGVSGIEGVFRRSCEKTVEVLRLHHQTIITILEVLLYDPLYDWTVSTAEANKRQKDEHDGSEMSNVSMYGGRDEGGFRDVNVTAERALLRLKAKLQGTESGKSTTVEDQVGTLIQQAVNPSNLCKLFHGWQPYL